MVQAKQVRVTVERSGQTSCGWRFRRCPGNGTWSMSTKPGLLLSRRWRRKRSNWLQKRRLETPQTTRVSAVSRKPPSDGSWPPSVARWSAAVDFIPEVCEVPPLSVSKETRWNLFMKLHMLLPSSVEGLVQHDGWFHLRSSGVDLWRQLNRRIRVFPMQNPDPTAVLLHGIDHCVRIWL